MADKMPTIGNRSNETSYPDRSLAGSVNPGDEGMLEYNMNAANFVKDPPVLNESPATKKSYSWNKGETGNAT